MGEFTRRTQGSVVWSSCRPSLLQSSYCPPPNDFIKDILNAEMPEPKPVQEVKPTPRTWFQYFLSFFGV